MFFQFFEAKNETGDSRQPDESENSPSPSAGMPQNEQTPHILGLHVVEQIAAAHGGRVTFGQNVPNGAKATVWLPLDQKAPVAFGQNVVK